MPGQFNYLNMNPLGLNTNDCVIRGISLLMDQSWEMTQEQFNQLSSMAQMFQQFIGR